MLSACLAIALLFGVSLRIRTPGWWQQRVIRLGQYSLIGYVIQIAILQMLSYTLGRPDTWSLMGSMLFVITLIITLSSVEAINWLCARYASAGFLYKAVFA
jgi:hypothetical protein